MNIYDDFISGYDIEVNASITNRFTLYRSIIAFNRGNSKNVRANNVWQKVMKAESVIQYLNYKDKIDYIGKIQNEFLAVHYDCSPKQKFFTYRLPELIDNIIDESKRGGISFRLSDFDRVPKEFLDFSGEDKLIYIIEYKLRTRLALDYLRGLIYLDGSRWGGGILSFKCTLSKVQASYLCRILKQIGFLSKSTNSFTFIQYLSSNSLSSPPICWKCGTATLVYFFERLFLEKYILNNRWHIVISKYRDTITKQGNILKYSNVTTSLHNIKSSKCMLKDKGKVDSVMKKLKFYGDTYAKKH